MTPSNLESEPRSMGIFRATQKPPQSLIPTKHQYLTSITISLTPLMMLIIIDAKHSPTLHVPVQHWSQSRNPPGREVDTKGGRYSTTRPSTGTTGVGRNST